MRPSRLRHVVVIVMDTARADAFEPYGAPAGATPAVRQLADRGWAAPYAVAPSSWTLPSHVGMLLGTSHRAAGLHKALQTDPRLSRPVLEAHQHRYLPAVLRSAGYRTVGASTNLWIQAGAGFDLGFDEFSALWCNRQPSSDRRSLRGAARSVRDAVAPSADDGLREVARVADAWARDTATSGTPSLLFLNLVECHSPYLPPRPYNDLPPLQRLRAVRESREHLTMEAVWQANLGGPLPPPAALERMRHLYARSVRYMDDWLASFVETLDRLGLLDDTLLVLTSDHGENLGEGGRLGHAFSLDERLVSVPLVVAGADAPAPTGPADLLGLPALVAAELGIDSPWEQPLERAVAVSRVEGVGEPDDPRVVDALQRWGLGDDACFRMTSDAACATDGSTKLVRKGGVEQVFDLQADVHEVAPLAPAEVEARAADVALLRRALDEDADPTRVAAGAPVVEEPDDEVTRRLVEQMKLLGYL